MSRGLNGVGLSYILKGEKSSKDVSWDPELAFAEVGSLVDIESMFDLKEDIFAIIPFLFSSQPANGYSMFTILFDVILIGWGDPFQLGILIYERFHFSGVFDWGTMLLKRTFSGVIFLVGFQNDGSHLT